MAESFNAGTVWVQVLPSLQGFKSSISKGVQTPVQQAASEAGNIFTRTFKKITNKNVEVAKTIPKAVEQSLPALRVQAKNVEKAYDEATAKVKKTADTLEQARKREEASALRVEKAERIVAKARKANDPARLANAEGLLASARKKHAENTKQASSMLRDYTKATADQAKADRTLKDAQDKLNAAMRATPGRLQSMVSKHVNNMNKTVLDSIGKLPGPVAKVGSAIGSGLSGAFKTAGNFGRSAFNGVRNALHGVAGAATVAAGVIGGVLASSIGGAVARVDTLNNFPRVMKNLGYSQEDAAGSAKKLAERLTGLPTALQDIIPLVQRLAPLSSNLDQATETGLAFNNMALASGKGMSDQSRAMEQYTQMLSTGTVDLMSWRTLMEVMPGQLDQMAVALLGTGNRSMDLYEAMKNGTVSFEDFNDAMVRLNREGVAGFASFEQQARDATAGIGTSFTNLRSRITQAVGNIIDAIGADKITAPVERLSSGISTVGKSISEFISGGGIGRLIPAASGVAAAFGGLLGPLSGFFKSIMGQIPLVGSIVSKLVPTISGPVGVAIGIFSSMLTNSQKLRETIGDAFSRIGEAFAGLFDSVKSTGGVFETIGHVMGWLGDQIAPLVGWLADVQVMLINGLGAALKWVSGVLESATGWISSTLIPVLAQAWEWVANKMAPVWPVLGQAVSTAWEWIKNAAGIGWSILQEVFSSVWEFITVRLMPVWDLLGVIVQTAWSVISDAISVAWSNIQPVFDTIRNVVTNILAPIFKWLYEAVIRPVFGLIVGVIVVAWTVISTLFNFVVDLVTNVVAPVFSWLYQNVIGPVFSLITTVIKIAWSIMAIIFNAIITLVGSVLGPVFETFADVISRVWDAVSDKISTVWNWLKPNVFDKISNVLSTTNEAFNRFKDTVAAAFDSIKAAAAKPINFVINTVYTDGIKSAFDTIASKIGISTRMPKVSPIAGYASGGVLPGYTPGRDVHRFYSPTAGTLLLSGGEGIIRPDALRRLGGKEWLDRVNRARGRGFSPSGDFGRESAFAEGGVWGRVKSFGSSAWHTITKAADFISDAIMDPLGTVAKLITGPAEALLSTINSSFWGQIAAGIPRMLFGGIGQFFKNATAQLGGPGLVGAARKYIGTPYVWGGSSIPPGLDCSGLVYYSLQQMGKNVPRLTAAGYQASAMPVDWGAKRPGDLLFWGSPANHVAIYSGAGRMVEAPKPGMSVRETAIWGSPTVGRYKYDQGGYLPPGMSNVLNATGKPEPVFTASQWDLLERYVNAPTQTVFPDKVELVLDDQTRLPAYVRALADEQIITAQRIVRSKR